MNSECFEVKLDVQRCKREDIVISFIGDCLVVQMKKCSPDDNSIVARRFSKRIYPLNLDKFDKNTLQYKLCDDGMLTIQVQEKHAAAQ